MNIKPSLTLAIIVTYFPERGLLNAAIAAFLPQVQKVLVIDNTPFADDRVWTFIGESCQSKAAISLVRCGENRGIATALNLGIDAAIAEAFDFVILSDQDSEAPQGMVAALRSVHDDRVESGFRVGCVAPEYFDATTGQSFPFQVQSDDRFFYYSVGGRDARPWIEIMTTITSGSLIPRDALEAVGPMRDGFFIDHVDTEWCHRARALGFHLYGTASTKLNHRLGDGLFRIWYLGWRNYSEYSPTRLYYRFRNFVLLCRLPYVGFRWKLRAAWYWAGNLYVHVVFSSARVANARMILKGLYDGLLGRDGPISRP